MQQIVECEDRTCRYNQDGFCRCMFLKLEIGRELSILGNDIVNICRSYEERKDGTV